MRRTTYYKVKMLLVLVLQMIVFKTVAQNKQKDTTFTLNFNSGSLMISQTEHFTFIAGSFILTEDVILESERRGIYADKVILELCVNALCQIEIVKIKTMGHLDSYNKLATSYCSELLAIIQQNKITNYLVDPENCENKSLVIRLSIQ